MAEITWENINITSVPIAGGSVYTYTNEDIRIEHTAGSPLLELKPIGDFVKPNSRVEITFNRLVHNSIETAVRSENDIPLAKDIVLRFDTNNKRSPKPRFDNRTGPHFVKLATRNNNIWTAWDDTSYASPTFTNGIQGDRQVYFVFLPDEDTTVAGIRITETWIRKPRFYSVDDPTVDEEVSFPSVFIPVSRNDIERDFAGSFGFPHGSEPLAVQYTLRLPCGLNNINNDNVYGGVRLKVELYNGVSYSEGEDEVEKPQIIQTKYRPKDTLKRITGAQTSAFSELHQSGDFLVHYVRIGNNVHHNRPAVHPLPFSITNANEEFTRNVNISNYRIDEIPVTEELWHFVRNWAINRESLKYTFLNNGSTNGDNYPVTNISWQDVIVWCNALSELNGFTGSSSGPIVYRTSGHQVLRNAADVTTDTIVGGTIGFRLASDIEWDYAARGGDTTVSGGIPWGFNYSGSNTATTVANFLGVMLPVRERSPNNLGLYDMSGNVDEWVWDRNGAVLTTTGVNGPDTGDNRIFRGGNYSTTGTAQQLGNARGNAAIDSAVGTRGFRVARNED